MGNNSWMVSTFFWRHLVPQNVGNIIFGCYFLNIGLGPKSQWSRHLFEKSIPGLFYSKPPRKVSATELELRTTKLKKPRQKPTNLFSNLDFLVKSGFPKILDLSMDFPRISHPMDFGFSGRPRERPTKTKIGRQGQGQTSFL